MVDTINPNTSQPDSWGDSPAPQAPATTPEDRFYGGFDQPGGTKINLAGGQPAEVAPAATTRPQAPIAQEPVPAWQPQPMPQAVSDVAAPVSSSEAKHTTYTNTSDMINWRGILVIIGLGVVATAIVGTALYFGLGAMNSSKLKAQEDQLTTIQGQLNTLSETPKPLELPVTETTTPEEVVPVETPVVPPVVIPVVTPPETPVVTPSVTPTENSDGSKTAAG